jgi:hypothetical protein
MVFVTLGTQTVVPVPLRGFSPCVAVRARPVTMNVYKSYIEPGYASLCLSREEDYARLAQRTAYADSNLEGPLPIHFLDGEVGDFGFLSQRWIACNDRALSALSAVAEDAFHAMRLTYGDERFYMLDVINFVPCYQGMRVEDFVVPGRGNSSFQFTDHLFDEELLLNEYIFRDASTRHGEVFFTENMRSLLVSHNLTGISLGQINYARAQLNLIYCLHTDPS